MQNGGKNHAIGKSGSPRQFRLSGSITEDPMHPTLHEKLDNIGLSILVVMGLIALFL